MPTRHGTDALAARIALCDNRSLHLRRPLASLARAREHFETLRTPAHRIITRDYHSSSALHPDQGAENQRCASTAQGGGKTPLTRYPSDLTDEEWERIAPLMPARGRRGRPREIDFREVINAVRYLVRSGCGCVTNS